MSLSNIKIQGIYWLISLLAKSWRVSTSGFNHLNNTSTKSPLACFWHGHYVPLLPLLAGRSGCIISSQSARGATIGGLASALGFEYILIPDRPTHHSMQTLAERLENTVAAGTAVDGPLGPDHQVKGGVVWLASQLDMALVPIAVRCRRALRLHQRWDNLMLPLPFAKVHISIGEPIAVPAKLSAPQRRQISLQLSEQLRWLEQKDSMKKDTAVHE